MTNKFHVRHQIELRIDLETNLPNATAKSLCEDGWDPEEPWKDQAEDSITFLFDDLSDEIQEQLLQALPQAMTLSNGIKLKTANQEAELLETEVSPN